MLRELAKPAFEGIATHRCINRCCGSRKVEHIHLAARLPLDIETVCVAVDQPGLARIYGFFRRRFAVLIQIDTDAIVAKVRIVHAGVRDVGKVACAINDDVAAQRGAVIKRESILGHQMLVDQQPGDEG